MKIDVRSFFAWLLAALGLPALLAVAAGLALHQSTSLPARGVWSDVVIVAQVAVVIALCGGVVARTDVARHRFYLASGFFLVAFVLGAAAGSWVARRNWGMNLSGNIVAEFLPQAAKFARLLNWRAVLLLAVWFGVSWLVARAWAKRLMKRPLPSAPGLHALLLSACMFGLATEAQQSAQGALPDDPILSLLRFSDVPALLPTPVRIAAWVRDEELRRTFDPGIGNRKNVILLLADGVRPNRLSFYGYSRETMPFLAKLMKSPGWTQLPVAYSAATESLGGIGSIVTGRSTRTMSARSYGIVEFFARKGYRTHLLLNGVHSWYELRSMYGSKLTTFHDLRQFDPGIPIHDDLQIVQWVEQLPDAGSEPSFVMLFLMGTHQSGPLAPEEAHWSRGEPGIETFAATPPGPREWALASDRYDDQLLATDRRIEKIWKLLEAKGYLHDSIVLFGSDHGQMLGEHRAFGHGEHLWEDAIRVPMGVWSDGSLPPINTARTAWTPDIAPTVAEAAGLTPLPSWEGLSLFSNAERNVIGSESTWHTVHVRSVLYEEGGRRWKLQQETDEDGVPVKELLFDVVGDPAENTDRLADAPPEIVSKLRGLLATEGALPARQ